MSATLCRSAVTVEPLAVAVQVAPPEALHPPTVTGTLKVIITSWSCPAFGPVVSAPVFLRISIAGAGGFKSMLNGPRAPCIFRETAVTNWGSDGNWNLPMRVFQLALLVAEK